MGAFTLAEVSSRGWGKWMALAGQLVLRGDVMICVCLHGLLKPQARPRTF